MEHLGPREIKVIAEIEDQPARPVEMVRYGVCEQHDKVGCIRAHCH